MTKTILHLCADIGSDTRYYQLDKEYEVILVGKDVGVENYSPPKEVHGIIANPVCTEFSIATGYHVTRDLEKGMFLVRHCQRIIEASNPKWWVIENPATGRLKEVIGKPTAIYQPWQFGSPWTKKTALWGVFQMPPFRYTEWEACPKNDKLYIRPGTKKPCLAKLHKSAVHLIPEFEFAKDKIHSDADFRSLCSQHFAKAFYEVNK
jgi:hypothetical protein